MAKCPWLGSVIPSRRVSLIVTCGIGSSYECSIIVSKSKVVIFGGATGDTGKYIITGDTYALDLISSKWSKLEGKFYLVNMVGVRNIYFMPKKDVPTCSLYSLYVRIHVI